MLHFENSQAQMIFSATGDGVAMILLHPILQITSNIQRPAEEPSLANPSIAYRKEVTRSCRVTSVEEQVAEEGAAGVLGLHYRGVLNPPRGRLLEQVLCRARAPRAAQRNCGEHRLAYFVADLSLHGLFLSPRTRTTLFSSGAGTCSVQRRSRSKTSCTSWTLRSLRSTSSLRS